MPARDEGEGSLCCMAKPPPAPNPFVRPRMPGPTVAMWGGPPAPGGTPRGGVGAGGADLWHRPGRGGILFLHERTLAGTPGRTVVSSPAGTHGRVFTFPASDFSNGSSMLGSSGSPGHARGEVPTSLRSGCEAIACRSGDPPYNVQDGGSDMAKLTLYHKKG